MGIYVSEYGFRLEVNTGSRMSEIGLNRCLFIVVFLISNFHLFAQTQKLNIIYIGDSITQGAMLNDPSTEAPPAIASAYLRTKEDIGRVEFSNQGISGFTTVDFLPSVNTVFNKAEQAAGSFAGKHSALIFSIMLGTNDSAGEGPHGSPVSAENYHDNLKAIIDRLLFDFPNCKVILQFPLWYSPNTYNSSRYLQEGLTRLQTYFPQIDKLITEYAKSHPKQVFAADKNGFYYFRKNYLTDLKPEQGRQGIFYLHPNKKGAEVLGNLWGRSIYKMISRN
jgi:lysophospholipase L1-like esterase